MPDSSPPDSTRTEVEAEIGRSLLFFQSLERTQKELLRLSGLSVTLGPQPKIHSPALPDAKATFGQLVDPTMDHVLRSLSQEDVEAMPVTGTPPKVSFYFSVGLTDADREAMRLKLQQAVAARNELVHHSLDWIRCETPEECQATCARLRAQREPFKSLHRHFLRLLDDFRILSRQGLEAFKASLPTGPAPAAPTAEPRASPLS